jgi:SAM-dependent methyltransferase
LIVELEQAKRRHLGPHVTSKFLEPLKRIVGEREPAFVEHEGQRLPPRALRFCGEEFKDDAYYLKSARQEAARLVQHAGLTPKSRVLDIGCGPGRLAIGILAELGGVVHYTGLDVHQPSVEWCQANLSPEHANFEFIRVDVANERYNPNGQAIESETRLPVTDASADVINLYSVFSHMTQADVATYLAEFRRVLSPGGHVFLTAFVEENVPSYSVNPEGYREKWSGALHCVRFEKGFLERMFASAGFRVDDFEYGRETNGQSAYYLTLLA